MLTITQSWEIRPLPLRQSGKLMTGSKRPGSPGYENLLNLGGKDQGTCLSTGLGLAGMSAVNVTGGTVGAPGGGGAGAGGCGGAIAGAGTAAIGPGHGEAAGAGVGVGSAEELVYQSGQSLASPPGMGIQTANAAVRQITPNQEVITSNYHIQQCQSHRV
ncbi:unnamed protein product [Protopolystoma xenopodis]|uniref:Uncharacterized protein n=1 Tax=Protopolystoma xenopodis TaxID=117903 RepID=A0A448WDQ1_9PLAT|nr:unnamed protein product [Protopolystoma xenopodis]